MRFHFLINIKLFSASYLSVDTSRYTHIHLEIRDDFPFFHSPNRFHVVDRTFFFFAFSISFNFTEPKRRKLFWRKKFEMIQFLPTLKS